MRSAGQDSILWEQVSRVHVTMWYAVGALIAPPSAFLSPHLSVTAILLAIVYGLLITVLHWRGGTRRSHQRKGTIGIVYVFLSAVPFILAWFLFSSNGWPLLPAVLVAQLAPVLLIALSFRRSPMHDPGLAFLDTLFQSHRLLYTGLAMVNSLMMGYGLPFLSVYLYAWVTNQVFGQLTLANISVLLLVGGMIAGGIYGVTLRARHHLRARS
jgi:hypothetical protein